MKVLIIEPHADDALLSCYTTLFNTDYEVSIMTLTDETNKDSTKLKDDGIIKELYQLKGLDHSDFKSRLTSPKYVKELYKRDGKVIEHLKLKLKELDASRYDKVKDMLDSNINNINSFDLVLVPLGIVHPDHLVVRELVDSMNLETKIRYYEDKPYNKRIYGQIMARELSEGMRLIEVILSEDQKVEKVKNLKKYYPTEVAIMRFDGDEVLGPDKYWDLNQN